MSMDELLTPVSKTYLKSKKEDEPLFTEVKPAAAAKAITTAPANKPVASPDESLDILRSQPDYDSLVSVLDYLGRRDGAFSLHQPSPKSAAIIQVLVTDIIPNYWALLTEGSDAGDVKDLELLVRCLRGVTGLNAAVTHLRSLVQESKSRGKEGNQDVVLHLQIFMELISVILRGDAAIKCLWETSTGDVGSEVLKQGQSKSLLNLVASGRVVSIASEAASIIGIDDTRPSSAWIASGLEVSRWIGRNVSTWAKSSTAEDASRFLADLFQRSMSLGYSEALMKTVIDYLLLSPSPSPAAFSRVCYARGDNKKITVYLLSHLSSTFLRRPDLGEGTYNKTVSAVAGLLHAISSTSENLREQLSKWCTGTSGAGLGDNTGIRRAVAAVLAQDKEDILKVLRESLNLFGDEIYIRHSAILQQNVHAEVLLLSAGYASRSSPLKLKMLLRSREYLNAITNRIAATQQRARFLGMVVGEALSSLADSTSNKLDFKMEEDDSGEADCLKKLVQTSDELVPFEELLTITTSEPTPDGGAQNLPKQSSKPKRKPKIRSTSPTAKPKAIIEEVNTSDDDDDDEDLKPYAKGSDPEDSDDDPTLVQRNKVRPPVYVRDLLTFFRASDDYDKQKLALQTAPALIRRKANFGSEVSSHAEELAGQLVGVQDKFEVEGFDDLRLQSMISLIIAQPKLMAPWFARTFFEGDYSLSQRTSVLVALGLSSRELGGFQTSEYEAAAAFPSKRLPEKLESLYLDGPKNGEPGDPSGSHLKALPSTALDTITKSLTSAFLEPLAAEAADAATGPDFLKLQSFTERYHNKQNNSSKSKGKPKPRVRAIPNTTAALLADYFFLPLTAHLQASLRSLTPVVFQPSLLAIYLQTLGVIVHAAGPSTLSLPQLTAELWGLLLGTRRYLDGDLPATRGWLVAMASLLEVNGGDMRRLCETHGGEVVETRQWVGQVFNGIRGEDGGEENEVKMLAAGVLIRIGEAIEKYQASLMGNMIGL